MTTRELNDFLTQTGPGTPMGNLFRRYWIPGADVGRTAGARLPAGARQTSVGAAAGVSRHAGARRRDRRVLRPPRRVALVRPQRGERAALPLSRLEIRRDRPMHRGAVGAESSGLLQEDQAERPIPASSWATSSGPIWGRPSTSRRCRPSNGRTVPRSHRFVSKRTQECNYLQAMEGGIDSAHVSFLHRHELQQ